ncbi:DEAD/DEAH box helicase [Streptomyces sp. NPDC058964]|uniref:DEAD/DEAH box helicase n=1 Tax=Streptomyces sp. NPDC058964 TaxID=3346681 RepID=UPI0036C228E4
MFLRTVDLQGPLVLVPSPPLDGSLRRLRAEHPYLPEDVHQLAADLDSRRDGVPATVAEPRSRGGARTMHVQWRTNSARLFPSGRRQDAYRVAEVVPLGFRHHHAVARGCLLVRPARWLPCHLPGEIPKNSEAHWPRLEDEWRLLLEEMAERTSAPALADRHARFLATVQRIIDTDERMSVARAHAAGDYPYRDVTATGEQRHGTRAVYEFDLVGDGKPGPGTLVQVRGEPAQRGRVVRALSRGTSVTVSFDRAVAWDSVPKQGALQITPSHAVHERQREAVRALRDRRSCNPHVLDVLVDRRLRPPGPVPGRFEQFEQHEAELDREQKEAFRRALAVEDLLVVLGPPGTGKTRVISRIARAVAASGTGERVLVASHTNRAVDNVLGRLSKDLVVVRVGNEGAVTSEGRPYLLEEQAAELRRGILGRLESRLAVPLDVEHMQKANDELGRLLVRLATLADEESTAHAGLAQARRATGGRAQRRVDGLVAERARLVGERDRNARRSQRLSRLHRTAARRARWRFVGFLFQLCVRRCERRLAAAEAAADALAGREVRNRTQTREAERELDAATRDFPAVRVARTQWEDARGRREACRVEAAGAAERCRTSVAAVEEPPAVPDPATAEAGTVDRELAALHAWMTDRLPLLTSRRTLLAEWRDEVSSATGQLHTELVRYAHVVAATCIGVASRPELTGLDFDLVVIDEVGQIGVPDVLVPLVRARRAVLVGDHRQLPPYLDHDLREWGERSGDPVAGALLGTSVLELLRLDLPDWGVVSLTNQRRMPSAVADFVSAAFYDGLLRTPEPDRPHDSRLFRTPLAFVDTSRLPAERRSERDASGQPGQERKGYVNAAEADLLTRLAAHYDGRGVRWAVIVPYAAQAALITAQLTRRIGGSERIRCNVGTVDSFQGGERDVVLYGFTRSNPGRRVGFLDELRRSNVAFTRVERQLVLVGDLSMLTRARDPGVRELARALREHLAVRGEIHSYDEMLDLLDSVEAGGDRT